MAQLDRTLQTRILVDGVIFDTYPHGGIARVYRELLPRVADQNPDIQFRVLIRNAGSHLLPQHVRILGLRFKPWNYRPSRVFSRVNQGRKRVFDEALVQWKPSLFQSTYYTLSPVPNVKTVAMVYDLIDEQFPFLMPNGPGFVSRQAGVIRQADAVVGISRATTESAIARFGLDRSRTNTLHLDASPAFRPTAEESKTQFWETYTRGKPFFLFVGSTGSYKNLGTLIRALGQLRDTTDHWLLLAGHSLQHLEPHWFDVAIQARVEDRISRLVHPDDELLCRAYNAAEAFVFPSLQEGFGIPLIEAMRCGTPVVASDLPVFHEICGDAALFFDPHDHQELARQLTRIRQPGVREQVVNLGFERARRFSWDQAAEQLGQIYLKLALSGQGAPSQFQ